MDHQFQRILDLVRKTGDRLVVTDTDGQNAYVVMDLDQYETLVDLEGDYFADDLSDYSADELDFLPDLPDQEIESDYATEKIDMMPPEEPPASPPSDIWQAMKPADSQAPTWDVEQMGEADRQEVAKTYQTYQEQVQNPSISPNPAKKPVNDEEFGEDQFYLEPID